MTRFPELTLSPCSPNSRLHPVPATPTDNALASLEQVDKHVAEAVSLCSFFAFEISLILFNQLRPLHQQMQHLRREMERLRLQVTENETLKTKVESLTSEVKDLKLKAKNAEAEVEFMRQSMSPQAFALATPLPGAMKVTENFSAPE